MKYPNILRVGWVIYHASENEVQVAPSGAWVPSRPLGFPSFLHRCKAAWLVFSGKADALTWDGDQ